MMYDENPQVAYWRERAEVLQDECQTLYDNVSKIIKDRDNWRYYYNEENKEKRRLSALIISFNNLPWYKKMFYKFKL